MPELQISPNAKIVKEPYFLTTIFRLVTSF